MLKIHLSFNPIPNSNIATPNQYEKIEQTFGGTVYHSIFVLGQKDQMSFQNMITPYKNNIFSTNHADIVSVPNSMTV